MPPGSWCGRPRLNPSRPNGVVHGSSQSWETRFRGVQYVDLLLRSGADEGIVHPDDNNKVAADVIGERISDKTPLAEEEIERVRKLLANAPANRAWRRRGFLSMCRAFPGRVQLEQENSSQDAGVEASAARRTGSREKQARARVGGNGALGKDVTADARAGGGWACASAKIVGLQEEEIFRKIVEYL